MDRLTMVTAFIFSMLLISLPASAWTPGEILTTPAQATSPKGVRAKCFTSHMRASDTRRCMTMLRTSRNTAIQWAPGVQSRGVKIIRATARDRHHGTLVVLKPVDKASPLLQQVAKTGRPLPQIVLRVQDAQGQYHTYKLDRCFVKSWSTSGDADDRPTEEVAFYYNKIG